MQGSMHPQDAHGQHGGPGFAPPNFAAWGLDGTTAQLGMQLGSSAVAAGQDYMQRNFGTILPSTYIKHHFNVSNSYVITKLRLVLFPWRQKSWARRSRISSGPSGGQGQNQAVQEWMAPREDVNCPDLYIPVMAIFTYVLLTALHAGINDGFNPGILGDSASRATAVVLLDFAFVKLGCYVLNITSSSQVVDLVAYGGYKFVGVILALVAGFLGASGALWWLVFVYAFLANAFFLLRSLRTLILPDASTAPPTHATSTVTHAQRRRRIVFLLLEAVLQVGYMGWLVRV
ncbi:hypothetical protein NLJ89_g5381 [Agrocybe chaxingu]|uniref:Protein YIF1 n=1 Tax=Agrocybe chaxingu TaxID=84603 RepID=A0A9W8K8D1_9AGAR|nr:hypothetical protein NLJ89_g5381 [Agrocybe chaxingu]